MEEDSVVKAVVSICRTTKGDNGDIAKLRVQYPEKLLDLFGGDLLQKDLPSQDIDTYITNVSCTSTMIELSFSIRPVK